MKDTLLSQALVLGLSLLGAFLTAWIVSLLLPIDPINPAPTVNYTYLFIGSFVVFVVFLEVALATGRRLGGQPVPDARLVGEVLHYNPTRKYGFAILDDQREVFFHESKLVNRSDRAKLRRGAKLSFFINTSDVGDRPSATMIEVVE